MFLIYIYNYSAFSSVNHKMSRTWHTVLSSFSVIQRRTLKQFITSRCLRFSSQLQWKHLPGSSSKMFELVIVGKAHMLLITLTMAQWFHSRAPLSHDSDSSHNTGTLTLQLNSSVLYFNILALSPLNMSNSVDVLSFFYALSGVCHFGCCSLVVLAHSE